ncbi:MULTISPECIES: DUF3597 domain-containing protein [Agrobacterium]|jgi:3-oxoacyl-ACP reductase-like protein|uniref:DUF3597 domain-containing protein n=1 Tax=Agrobacterium fabrum (strain C58 / ATCC 33970) TaxID=176299 RepID=A9CG22_AGRFC|nr:DUF3597 domain-containing protein [Agrobacterium fabrum]KEY56361.1 5'-nucleotidase [Agrobacterium tumefaciens]AAK89337.1 hypothetical protein Atu4094 [Agrobacterium fabrum str. C58]KJX86152.1 THAP domain-containing protein 4 [Agrobacterium tumefaciens]MCX2877725.1 DUF3597 domain-containing protein [Agrobacterium fabrum]NMV72639.1 DUF3597 domain-containing protein [Agrobacterium fabrum]
MSFFNKIKDAIFGKAEAAPQTSAPAGTSTTTASPAAPAQPASPAPTAAAPAPTGTVDVASILDAAVKKNGQKLDWKHSIVDLLKALDLDSSLTARKELASELGYTGDTSDSATMNIWLHKAVIKKLSENGGKVPADLLD